MGKKVDKANVAVRHRNALKKPENKDGYYLPRAGHVRNAQRAGIKFKSPRMLQATDEYAQRFLEELMRRVMIIVQGRRGKKITTSDVKYAYKTMGENPQGVYGI